jgi:hypothetical protein
MKIESPEVFSVALKPSPAMLFETDGECPQCNDVGCTLWHMECCGLVMCDGCRFVHDKKKGFLTSGENHEK